MTEPCGTNFRQIYNGMTRRRLITLLCLIIVLCACMALPMLAQSQFPPPSGAIDAVIVDDIPFGLCGDEQLWEFYFADGSTDYEWYYVPNGQCAPGC